MTDCNEAEDRSAKKPEQPRPIPPAIQRLLDEVKAEDPKNGYNRMHNRHNRSYGCTTTPKTTTACK